MAKRSWKVQMGHIVTVPNKKQKFGAAPKYALVRLQDDGGRENTLLFTPHQLQVALDRARKNPEDLIAVARLLDLLD